MSRPGPGGRREGAIPFQLLQNEFFRLVENYLHPSDRPKPPNQANEPEQEEPWSPPLDVYETPEETLVLIELPGVDAGRVELSVTGNILTARGTKPTDAGLEPFLRARERRFGDFAVEVPLPNSVDFDAARAEARDGVLTIHLPKRQAEEPRSIPIRTS